MNRNFNILLLNFDLLCKPLIINNLNYNISLRYDESIFNGYSLKFYFAESGFKNYLNAEKFTNNYINYLLDKIGSKYISEFYRYSTIGDFKLYLKDIDNLFWIDSENIIKINIYT